MSEPARHRSPVPDAPAPRRLRVCTLDVVPDVSGALMLADSAILVVSDLHFEKGSAFAARGLRYNQFHTTALCSPTRASLLTGRNHHSVHMGGITEIKKK